MPTKKRTKASRHREEASDGDALWEWQVPLALLIVGGGTLLVGTLVVAKPDETAKALVAIVLYVLVYVPITVAAMYFVAGFLGVSFGFLNTALLKLAGITAFTLSVNLIGDWMGFPIPGWLLAVAATYYLFSSCFYLDAVETIKSVVLISVIRGALGMAVAAILVALIGSAAGPGP